MNCAPHVDRPPADSQRFPRSAALVAREHRCKRSRATSAALPGFILACASLGFAVVHLGAGCATTEEGTTLRDNSGGSAEVQGPQRIADDTFDESCCTKREFDLNRDAKPDAYVFVKVVDNETKVMRKENDLNYDGKIDIVRILDDRGNLVQERLDTDFDGRIDLVIILERGKIVRKEQDTNFDTKVDHWRYFDNDRLARVEADLNYDGRVDYWEYFEGEKLDRVGIDRDADGNVDEWIQSEQT